MYAAVATLYVYVCGGEMCVCERERERKRESGGCDYVRLCVTLSVPTQMCVYLV